MKRIIRRALKWQGNLKFAPQTIFMAKKKSKQAEPKKLKDIFRFDFLKDFSGGETTRFIIGLMLLIVALFMLLAFTSYFFTGAADQTGVESKTLQQPANYGGSLGAYVAHYFLNDCFGIAAIFIPIFFLMLSMRLMRA